MTTRPPCIVCGKRRGHATDVHDKYRLEYRRCKNLLRRTWPRLPGLSKLLAFYEARDPKPAPTPAQGPRVVGWHAKVHRDGTVSHHAVFEETPA